MMLYRICSLGLITILLAATNLAAADTTVLSDSADAPLNKALYSYLQSEAARNFQSRRETVAALKTADEIHQRQAALRKSFIDALGGFPEKTPLRSRVTGSQRRDGYRIEKVVYESRPNHHVTAVMYIPEGEGPFPGVLVPCGHSANGKAAEPYQRACILMAKHGLAVLCYDPIGQGERSQLLNEQGKPAIPGSTSEHTMVGVGALLVGSSTATYRIWDGIRSLDYLASRPEVDPDRLGCTGNSGGGTLTAYLMALDERILAAAPSCYITSLERLFATIGPQDAEQNITGQVAFGMEHADYVTMRAPRPTLICTGTQDFFDIQGAWTTYREAKLLYGMLGHGERVDLFEFNDKHGFSQPRREAALRWMRRWLLQVDDAPTEPDFAIARDEDLLCTASGQVLTEYSGRSAFDLTVERARQLAANRSDGPADLRQVRKLIALAEQIQPARRQDVGTLQRDGYQVRRSIFTADSTVPLAALEFVPAKEAADRPLILYIPDHGVQSVAGAEGPLAALALEGRRVLAVDLRGMGETAPQKHSPNKPPAFGVDSKEAFLGIHLNRPLLGQRVSDLLAVIQALAEEHGEVEAIGVGFAGPIVLHAAAMEPRIKRTTLEESLLSWTAVATNAVSRNQLGNVVPGALVVYDLPTLAMTIAPRGLRLVRPVDGAGNQVAQSVAENAYRNAAGAWQQPQAEGRLSIESRE